MKNSKQELFDVIAVHISTERVRILDTNKTEENAEAIVDMAVARRGVECEFFVAVPMGKYQEGDKY